MTDEQLARRAAARKYARERCAARRKQTSAPATALARAHSRVCRMGFLGINIDRPLRRLGLGNLEALLVLEEFQKCSAALAFPVFESCVVQSGPSALRQRNTASTGRAGVCRASCSSPSPCRAQAGSALTDPATTHVSMHHVIISGTQALVLRRRTRGWLCCLLPDERGMRERKESARFTSRKDAGLTFGKAESLMGFHGVQQRSVLRQLFGSG